MEPVPELAIVLIRFLLAGCFLTAAIAKVADRAAFARAIVGFGVPISLAPFLAVFIPFGEAVVGLLLLSGYLSRSAGVAAFILLIVFTMAIVNNLMRGRTPDCQCFGQLHSTPVTWWTVARNGAFAASAALVGWRGRDAEVRHALSALGRIDVLALGFGITAFLIVLIEGWCIFYLLRQHGRLMVRIDSLERKPGAATAPAHRDALPTMGLPIGSPAPVFAAAATLEGEQVGLVDLLALGKRVLLVFSDVNCGPCEALMPFLATWQRQYVDVLTLAIVSHGAVDEHRRKFGAHDLRFVILQKDREISERFKVAGTPSAVLLNIDGSVAVGLSVGPQGIADLVSRATANPLTEALRSAGLREHVSVPGLRESLVQIGDVASRVELPDLRGTMVELSSFKGRDVLILLWNPSCGFCQKMLPDLHLWERTRSPHSPDLFVISTGTKEANEALGLRSTVVVDRTATVGQRFGLNGTPSARWVDAEGRVASEVAVGAAAVLKLVEAATERDRVAS